MKNFVKNLLNETVGEVYLYQTTKLVEKEFAVHNYIHNSLKKAVTGERPKRVTMGYDSLRDSQGISW